MKSINNIGLSDVQAVYSGAEGDLWELVMGEQIHIGGLASSMDLAQRADISPNSTGVDLCCCNGAGMRFLTRFRNVARMTGVDATPHVVEVGRQRCQQENLADRISFVLADVCNSGLPSNSADFVWGEDAWCYVADKPRLIAEAARIVRPGGLIAFTDWVETAPDLSPDEATRYLKFMKFPNVQDPAGYKSLLEKSGCTVIAAEPTGRFKSHIDLYLNMLNMQLTYDALKRLNFNMPLMQALSQEMLFMQQLAHSGKIDQALFIARKSG